MESQNVKIRKLSQAIIEKYTYYVRDEVRKGRECYKSTGIDKSLMVYREFFLNILSLSLGLDDDNPNVDKEVKEELIKLIQGVVNRRRFKKASKNQRAVIYRTCELIFDMVVLGILREEYSLADDAALIELGLLKGD